MLVKPITLFGFATVDHVIVKQIVVAAALPNLRVHQNRAVQSLHAVGQGSTVECAHVVVAAHHIRPPSFLDVSFKFDTQRAVVPKALQATVDFTGLKKETTSFAQRDN